VKRRDDRHFNEQIERNHDSYELPNLDLVDFVREPSELFGKQRHGTSSASERSFHSVGVSSLYSGEGLSSKIRNSSRLNVCR
jgi:hypothetical protein